jgi:hypothetical protein
MKAPIRKTAFAFAALVGALATLPLASRAETPLPGQPGADTSQSAVQARGGPYMLMVLSGGGLMTDRQISAAAATELMKHAKPLKDMIVLMHDGKAYVVEDMKMADGRMLSTMLKTPESMGF